MVSGAVSYPLLALVCVASCRFGFDPLLQDADVLGGTTCPSDYTTTIPSSPSRYKIKPDAALVKAHHTSCANDLPGSTHLMTVNDAAELADLAPLLDAVVQPDLGRFYIGAIQLAGETDVATGWIGFDGAPVPADTWGNGEPDDFDGVEDGREQHAGINSGRHLLDVSGNTAYGAVCECDGTPIAGAVLSVFPP